MAIHELSLFISHLLLKRGPLALQPKGGKEPANKVNSERQQRISALFAFFNLKKH
jgi:hypothetical protein